VQETWENTSRCNYSVILPPLRSGSTCQGNVLRRSALPRVRPHRMKTADFSIAWGQIFVTLQQQVSKFFVSTLRTCLTILILISCSICVANCQLRKYVAAAFNPRAGSSANELTPH